MNTRKADGKILQFRLPAVHPVGNRVSGSTEGIGIQCIASAAPEPARSMKLASDAQQVSHRLHRQRRKSRVVSQTDSGNQAPHADSSTLWPDAHIRAHFPNRRADGTFDNGPQHTRLCFWQRVLTALDIPWTGSRSRYEPNR